MDVTIIENVPYYSKTYIQGEKLQEEYQFCESMMIEEPVGSSSPKPIITPSMGPQEGNKELLVYFRCQKNPKLVEHHELLTPCQADDPTLTPNEVIQCNTESCFLSNDLCLLDDLEMLIVQRKWVRSCTQHPISYFVSYQKLSPNYRAFTTNLVSIQILDCIQEALLHAK